MVHFKYIAFIAAAFFATNAVHAQDSEVEENSALPQSGDVTQNAGLTVSPAPALNPSPAPALSASPAPQASQPKSDAISLPHWVGPLKGKPIDGACYRKTYIAKNKLCGAGYNFDNVATCWTQCPVEYPVECGMECIPQNMDCTKEILKKVTAVANVAVTAASSGVFGQLSAASKGVQIGVKCGIQLYNIGTKIVSYIDEVENGGKVDTTKDQLMFLLSKSDLVVYDLPVAVTGCLGMNVPAGLGTAKEVLGVVKNIVGSIVNNKKSGVNLLDFKTFVNTTISVVPEVKNTVTSLTDSEQEYIKGLVKNGVTCGTDIVAVINKVIAGIQQIKTEKPSTAADIIKFAVLNSDLVLKQLPAVVSSCVKSATGFSNRDEILKTIHVIIDRITAAASQNGNPVSTADFAITVTNMGLDAISLFDPTGLAALAAEYVQPICGPTVYVGDVDSGPADKALGLTSVEKAFRNSTGTWSKQGDGQLKVTFTSVDDKNVRVNIMSGGQKIAEVPVNKGETVVWTKPLADLQGKTLYMDRWRPGFLGIPGTGGGSLLTWVPNQSGGSLDLQVRINPTSFSDHKLRQ